MRIHLLQVNRKKITAALFGTISIFKPVSVTIVGSFTVSDDISVISDIDTVVIVDKLNKQIFDEVCLKVSEINCEDLGLPGFNLKVNSTFGPLKFDEPNTAVVHLMIYDLEGHKDHVLKSPFTCYDWERSNMYYGKSLREVYPVLGLQPNDFIKARRGLGNYINDLQAGCISYREYSDENGKLVQKVKSLKVDSKHKGEFAYHIVRNLIFNYLKMLRKENVLYSDEQFIELWRKYCSELSYFIDDFIELKSLKSQRAVNYPESTIADVQKFVQDFACMIESKLKKSSNLYLIRHAKTELNDGSFLGQERDPEILEIDIDKISLEGEIFSSPLTRALQTSKKLFPNSEIILDANLKEIKYGDAEGLTYGELMEEYPDLIQAWSTFEDRRFPKGENSEDVLNRFLSFVEEKVVESENYIVSHNVVIRNAVGYSLGLPTYTWFVLPVDHNEKIKMIRYEADIYSDLELRQREKLSDALTKVLNG